MILPEHTQDQITEAFKADRAGFVPRGYSYGRSFDFKANKWGLWELRPITEIAATKEKP